MSGTFTAIDSKTNKIVWQNKTPYRLGGGATVTAGGLIFRGEPDGNFLALDARTGAELWRVFNWFWGDAPPRGDLGGCGVNCYQPIRGHSKRCRDYRGVRCGCSILGG